MKKKKEKKSKALWRAYGLVFKTAPVVLIVNLLIITLAGLAPTGMAILMGRLVDKTIGVVNGIATRTDVLYAALLLIGLATFNFISTPLLW